MYLIRIGTEFTLHQPEGIEVRLYSISWGDNDQHYLNKILYKRKKQGLALSLRISEAIGKPINAF